MRPTRNSYLPLPPCCDFPRLSCAISIAISPFRPAFLLVRIRDQDTLLMKTSKKRNGGLGCCIAVSRGSFRPLDVVHGSQMDVLYSEHEGWVGGWDGVNEHGCFWRLPNLCHQANGLWLAVSDTQATPSLSKTHSSFFSSTTKHDTQEYSFLARHSTAWQNGLAYSHFTAISLSCRRAGHYSLQSTTTDTDHNHLPSSGHRIWFSSLSIPLDLQSL